MPAGRMSNMRKYAHKIKQLVAISPALHLSNITEAKFDLRGIYRNLYMKFSYSIFYSICDPFVLTDEPTVFRDISTRLLMLIKNIYIL